MIFNPIVHVRKTIITLLLIILWPVLVYGETIFSDNFDSCSINCTVTTTGVGPTGWGGWHKDETSATIGGVTHYSGEIISPGRGGVGKSLKMWRAAGVFGDYAGVLYYYLSSGSYNHFFMSYSLKIPTAFDSTEKGTGFKSWRIETTGGSGQIYLNFLYGDGSSLRNSGKWGIYDGGAGWTEILSNKELQKIWDGNWHTIEWEFGLNTNLLRLYVDSVLKYEDTNRTWAATGNLKGMQHINIGNTYSHNGTWQTGWQAMELDDFVLSTTYVGLGAGGADSPPLTKQPNPPVNLQLR